MSIHPGIVYVVDDDEAFRDSVAWLLQTHGYQARLFPNAEAFLLEVKPGVGGPPRCAVLDVRMPGMSGPQAQEALAERGIKIPLIFVTAHADVPIAVTAIKRGAFDFIEKPFAEGDLLKRVEKRSRLLSKRKRSTARCRASPRDWRRFRNVNAKCSTRSCPAR